MPVSGATKAGVGAVILARERRLRPAAESAEDYAQPVFDDELLVAAGIIVGAALLWWWLRREDRLLLVFVAGVFSLAAGHLVRFALSALSVQPDVELTLWYFAPAYLMMALARATGGLGRAGRHTPCHHAAVVAARGKWLGVGLIVLGSALAGRNAGFPVPFRMINSDIGDLLNGWSISNYMGILTMNRVLPEGEYRGVMGCRSDRVFLGIPGSESGRPGERLCLFAQVRPTGAIRRGLQQPAGNVRANVA